MLLAVSFDNYDWEKNGWSIKLGIDMFIYNFFIYTGAGIVIDLFLNCLGQCLCCKKFFVR